MVTRKDSSPAVLEALEALRPHMTADFLKEFRRIGKEHGYRNVGCALAHDFEIRTVESAEVKTTVGALTKALAGGPKVKGKIVKVSAVDRSHKDWTFVQALRAVSKAVAKRATLPILATVKIEPWHDGMVKLTATDFDKWLESYAIVDYSGPAVCVEPKALLAAVTANKTFSLKAGSERGLIVASGNSEAILETRKADDFPTGNFGPFDAAAFAVVTPKMIEWASEACARDDSRPVLSCVRIAADGAVTASDGFRLRTSKREPSPEYVRVHFDAVKLIPSDATGVYRSNNLQWLQFVGRNVTLYAHDSQGSFPNFEQLIPRDADRKATFSAPSTAIRDAFAKMGTVVQGGRHDSGIVRMRGAYGDTRINISAKREEIGDASVDVYGEFDIQDDMLKEAGGMKCAFNIEYLKAAARDCGDMWRFSFFGPSAQCRIDHENGYEMIMPMFVQW